MSVEGEPTDEALMLAYAGGDASSFEQLFRRHRRPLFSFLLHNAGSRTIAEDLFQEIFLRLIRRREQYRPTGKFRTWLFTIAHNVLTDHRRRSGVRGEQSGESSMTNESEAGVPGPNRELASSERSCDPLAASEIGELRERIEAALLQIPADQREVFLLRERGGLDFQRVAEVTGAGIATVKSRMRYALANLRRCLEGDLSSISECLHE